MNGRINLQEMLMSGGIVPNQTVFYNTNDIINNIGYAVAKPQLTCNGSPPEFQEIRLCVDLKGNNFIDCQFLVDHIGILKLTQKVF